jgi:acyl-CoA hydrolase
LTADEAAARLRASDTLGIPLGPGQPPEFLQALGKRDDWEDLRIYGALLAVGSDVFNHPNVHYLSGFFGPLERMLRDAGANIGFAPADFRRLEPLLAEQAPRVMATVAAPPDRNGYLSLSLHAGGTADELHRAGADPDRVLVVEASERFPSTHGLPPEHLHALHVDEVDVLVESAAAPLGLPDPPPSEADRAIAEHAARFIPDGATLQTGIGSIPSTLVQILAESDGGGYGVHSEMFTTGLMRLHRAGKVANEKGQFDGVSVTTFAFGTEELYEWLDGNQDVAFLPVDVVNNPDVIARNRGIVTINGALAIDIHGQVVADTLQGRQFSGIGGHEDFVAGPGLSLDDRSLLCLPSTATVDGELHSRIVPWFDAGAVITTPRHQIDVVVTEYGIAELQGKTVHQRGEALAAIAHPDFRDELLAAAERASRGGSPLP